ncbi:ribosomal protein L7Ae/L30e/S12e/Gadd45 [Tanacetum coccineum]
MQNGLFCKYLGNRCRHGIINQLACMGIKLNDVASLWLLGTLPDTWETFRTSLSNSTPDGVITMELAKVQAKEKIADVDKNKHKKDDDGDDSTKVNTTTDEFFVCSDYDMVNLAHDDSSWILDSGATCHVATRKEYFSSYTPGMELVLHNVKHVPDMRLNIISTGLLDEDGYHNSSGNGLWKVTLGSLIVARGKRESKLYMTHPKISKSIVNAIDNDDMTELWHKRLGHMSEKGMSILSKKNVIRCADINMKKAWKNSSIKRPPTEDTANEWLAERIIEPYVRESDVCFYMPGFPASFAAKDVSYHHYESLDVKHMWHISHKMKIKALMARELENKLVYKLKTEEYTPRPEGTSQIVVNRFQSEESKEIYMEQPEGFRLREEDYKYQHWKNCPIEARFEQILCYERLGASKTNPWHSDFPAIEVPKLHISQEQYIEKVLRRFNMDKAKMVSSPLTPNFKLTDKDCPSSKKNIEKMDRPDLAHALVLSVGSCQILVRSIGKLLNGYFDICEGKLSSQSRIAKVFGLVYTKSEYVSTTEVPKTMWLKRFLQELGFKQQRYAVLCDNQSTIHLAKNSMFHKRTKHIDIRYHWIRDAIEDGMFELNKVHTDDNASDMLTKAVAREKILILRLELEVLFSVEGGPGSMQSEESAVFTNEWDHASLEYSQETKGPYCTDLPTPDDIRRLFELERAVVDRTIKSQTVALNPNQILTKELSPDMKQWEEVIRENVFGLGGHQDRLPACLAHMLYCIVAEEQYNLAYFFVKRIECARATPTVNLPYDMFLTRLYRYVMETYPHLDNGTYDIVERVMRPLALRQTRRPRSDRSKARRSVSSSSSHH